MLIKQISTLIPHVHKLSQRQTEAQGAFQDAYQSMVDTDKFLREGLIRLGAEQEKEETVCVCADEEDIL